MKSAITLLSQINKVIPLSRDETDFFESILVLRPFKQGEMIVKSGDPARYLMYVGSGYLMTYYTDKNGLDHVVRFCGPGWWCSDIYGISDEARTPYSTKGLGDGELLLLPRPSLQLLLEKYPRFEKFFRLMFQGSVIKQQMRFIESYTTTAEERYQTFAASYPGIEQFIPQKYIASYLGITPEFLSKTRSRLLRKA